jgi:hypothetical protein
MSRFYRSFVWARQHWLRFQRDFSRPQIPDQVDFFQVWAVATHKLIQQAVLYTLQQVTLQILILKYWHETKL